MADTKAESRRIAQELQWRRNAEKVIECECSELGIREWCKQEGVSPSTYYRWRERARFMAITAAQRAGTVGKPQREGREQQAMVPHVMFAELPVQTSEPEKRMVAEPASLEAAIRIKMGGAVIEIQGETDARLAESVVRALAKQC